MKYNRIKELRKDKEISQLELSKETGISQSAIAKWELDKTEPTASAIIKLSVFFDVSADYILGIEDDLGNKTYSDEFIYHDGGKKLIHRKNNK